MKKYLAIVVWALSGTAFGADLSLVSGFLEMEKDKRQGSNAGSQTHVSASGRFEDVLSTELNWFAQGGLSFHTYTAGEGGKAPSDGTGVSAGGGVRWYFTPFTTGVVPFLAGLGVVETDQDVSYPGTAFYEQTTRSGLYYGGNVGMRVAMNSRFFVELELPVFKSALFETIKTENNSATGNTKTEKTRMDLFVKSSAGFNSLLVNVGMKL